MGGEGRRGGGGGGCEEEDVVREVRLGCLLRGVEGERGIG